MKTSKNNSFSSCITNTDKNSILNDFSLRFRYDLAELKSLSKNLGFQQEKANLFSKVGIRGRMGIDKDIEFAGGHLHQKKRLTMLGHEIPDQYNTDINKKDKKLKFAEMINGHREKLSTMIPSFTVQYDKKLPTIKQEKENIFDISEISSNSEIEEREDYEEITKRNSSELPLVLSNLQMSANKKNSFANRNSMAYNARRVNRIANNNNSNGQRSSIADIKNLNKENGFNNKTNPITRRTSLLSPMLSPLKGINLKLVHHTKRFSIFKGEENTINNYNQDSAYNNKNNNFSSKKSIASDMIRIISFNKKKQYGKLKVYPKINSILRPNSKSLNNSISTLNNVVYANFHSRENSMPHNNSNKHLKNLSKNMIEHRKDEDDFNVHINDAGNITLIKNYLITPRGKSQNSFSYNNNNNFDSAYEDNSMSMSKLPIVTIRGQVDLRKLIENFNENIIYDNSNNGSRYDSEFQQELKTKKKSNNNSMSMNSILGKSKSNINGRNCIPNSDEDEQERFKEIRQKNMEYYNKYKSSRKFKFNSEMEENTLKMNTIGQKIKRVIFNASIMNDKIDKKIQFNINNLMGI